MKFWQAVAINAVFVVVALAAYDAWRDDGAGPQRSPDPQRNAPDTASLEQRLERLEADKALFLRLQEELRRLSTERGPAPPATTQPRGGEARPREPGTAISAAEDGMPTADEIRRFKKLREALRREERVEKNRKRVDRALAKLSINLTDRQRERIHHAHAAFEPEVMRIWGEAKTEARETAVGGGKVDHGELIATTTARIQEEFAATLTGIVRHEADATAIAGALMAKGG